MPNDIRPDRLAIFSHAYYLGLSKALAEHPEDYADAVKVDVGLVHGRMIAAVQSGSYNHDGRGFKNACKALGIKHTRKAIAAYLAGA